MISKVRYCKSILSLDGSFVVHSGAFRNLLLGVSVGSAGPDYVDHFVAASDSHLFHDAVYMILYSILRQIQLCSDFLRCQARGNQGYKLALPEGKPELRTGMVIGYFWFMLALLLHTKEEGQA